MTDPEGIRKLGAILAADVAGYSRLMGDDEAGTVGTLTEYRKSLRNTVHVMAGA
jgi:adenylate cyclase